MNPRRARVLARTEKRCNPCGAVKPLAEFGRNRNKLDGCGSVCRPCAAAVQRRRRLAGYRDVRNPEDARNRSLRRKYGLTLETYAEMLAAQGGVCAICRQVSKSNLHVDHCHESGLVRGLLCQPCNTSLGLMSDDPKRLRSAASYLEGDSSAA